jgi:hypothetical protein
MWNAALRIRPQKPWAGSKLTQPDPNASAQICVEQGHAFSVNVGGKIGRVRWRAV